MAENRKKRIARIGNIPSGKDTTKLHCDDDRSLVYDIMESMNKSQNVISYQQFEKLRSQEKPTSRTNNSDQSTSSKQNGKTFTSKQKKFVPEKTHPLMAKCQKSMKYLKKNRCIPKPRAHVGFIQRPSQIPTSSFKQNNMYNDCSVSNRVSQKECSVKFKRNSKKKRDSPEMNNKRKKAKIVHSENDCNDTNAFQTESFVKVPNLTSDADMESDDNFELFLKKHHPEKCKRRKSDKRKVIYAKKITKITRKTLSELEDSSESEVEVNTLVENRKSINVREKLPQRRFQRIAPYENSDESSTDSIVNEFGTANFDSISSSEDENVESISLNEEKIDFDDSNNLCVQPAEQSSVVSSPTSLSELKDTLCWDLLKLKCKIPCYVAINRDPVLDEKAASLHHANNLTSNSYDEDDCVIINENISQSLENSNSNQAESIIRKSPFASEALIDINVTQNKVMPNDELMLSSNEKSAEIICVDKSKPMEVLEDEKVVLRTITSASSKSFCDTEKDECLTLNKSTRLPATNINSDDYEKESTSVMNTISRHVSDLSSNETDYLNNEMATSASENEVFNVQIFSVKSLNESDVIVLSDDEEEKDLEAVPAVVKTKEGASEDSDIEIICLDSSVAIEEKSMIENMKDVDNGTQNKGKGSIKDNPANSSIQTIVSIEDDCIILDDLDITNKNISPVKNVEVRQNSAKNDVIYNEKTNSNINVETTSVNALRSDNDSILKTLETIDINCINKILKETSVAILEKDSIPGKVENSLCDNILTSEKTADSFSEKRKQSENGTCVSEKHAFIDARITPISMKTFQVNSGEKHPKLVQNSNIFHGSERGSENVSSSMKTENVPSSSDCDKSSTVSISSSAVPKLCVSKKDVVATSRKMESNALLNSTKNQMLPVCTKMERCESLSDELDIIAAESIKNLNEKDTNTIVPLIELYKAEYAKFMEIKCTEENVTAGLKLLEDKQNKKLLAISSSIKNIVRNDACFHKVNNESKSDSIQEVKSFDKVRKSLEYATPASLSINKYSGIMKDDKVKIFDPYAVKRTSEVLKSVGSSSSQEVYKRLINSVCAECGKHAVFTCFGCAKIYYCSENCGLSHWNKGHNAACRR